jgi:energy-coupling factor transport system permease protein
MNPSFYDPKNTFFHKLDPRTKILMLLGWFAIALAVSELWHALCVLGLAVVYVTAARSWSGLMRIRLFILIIAVFTVVIWSLVPREGEVVFLFIKGEAVLFGMVAATKIIVMLVAGIVFLSTTSVEESTIGLVKLGVPYVMCFAFSTALRLVPTFAATGATVVEAQRSRGLELDNVSLWNRMKAYIPLMAPIFLVSIRNANLMAMALEARGFGSSKKRTFYIQLRMRPGDWLALSTAAALVVASIYISY